MKIAYSCVVDANPKFEWQAVLWAHSLLRNGGCQAENLKIHCLPGVTKHFYEAMGKLGVDLIEINPFEGNHGYCNKIQQCFSPAFKSYNKVVLTDTDLFFLAPPYCPSEAIFEGMVVRLSNPPLNILRTIYNEAGVKQGKEVLVSCALSPEEKTFQGNLNGGYYVIDSSYLEKIGSSWKKYALWLIARMEILGSYKAHVDQVAMSLALDSLMIEISLLSSQNNFSVNIDERRLTAIIFLEELKKLNVLHYHSNVRPSGEIKLTGVPLVDEAIQQANRDISTIIRDNFDNLLYWNNRYVSYPELGSGVGSRGKVLEYKKNLLQKIVPLYNEKSVLEIGCGDLETSKALEFKDYCGYDLSFAALEIAKIKRPDWRFIQGSLDPQEKKAQADLVICLDVLIHQKKKEEYLGLLTALVQATNQRLIVSGYEIVPQLVSNITAFHEPLSKTLHRFGVFKEIVEVGRYNDVSMMVADKIATGPSLHRNDLPLEIFNAVAPLTERRDILRSVMDRSREHLGFFTQTSSRMIEYPWLIDRLSGLSPASHILDIGSGISPIPIMLADHGISVSCVDAHSQKRTISDRKIWNEWGFFDYSFFSPRLHSFHTDILKYDPPEKFDAIYSISVFEHMPRLVWEKTIDLLKGWIKPDGLLMLTLDLIPGTYALWNKSEGKMVDQEKDHGLLKDLAERIQGHGFVLEEFFVKQKIPYSRTDVAFLKCRMRKNTIYPSISSESVQAKHLNHQSAKSLEYGEVQRLSDNNVKKKLYIHIGTPKTGSSALQLFFYENYEALKAKGILYPKSIIGDPNDPKHQPLMGSVYSRNPKRFDFLCQRIGAEGGGSLYDVVVSSEGFYHHINEFSKEAWHLIKRLAEQYQLKIVVFLRPQAEYLESMHRQYLKNPKGIIPEYGSGMTIIELFGSAKIQQNMDYYDSLIKWAEVIGEENIIVKRYSKKIIEDFLDILQVSIENPIRPKITNLSLTRELAELLRKTNPHVAEDKRNDLIKRMEAYIECNPIINDSPFCSPLERKELTDRYRMGNREVAKKWLNEQALFPAMMTLPDPTWTPLNLNNDRLTSLLRELYAIERN